MATLKATLVNKQMHRLRLFTALKRNYSSAANANGTTEAEVKPFSEIPGPRGLPFIGNLIDAMRGGLANHELHNYIQKQHDM